MTYPGHSRLRLLSDYLLDDVAQNLVGAEDRLLPTTRALESRLQMKALDWKDRAAVWMVLEGWAQGPRRQLGPRGWKLEEAGRERII